nr:retrotransposon protein, putative, unclassified [Tanacetum cinerariifolium]
MDMKSAFLYGTIDEEVYVTQPPSFVDPKFPNKVYKVVKALYGLHQAPRACVKTASTLIETQKPFVKDEEVADVNVHLSNVILLACSIPIGWAYAFHQDKASLSSGDIVDLIGDEDPTDEDGDTEVSVSLGEISSERKKY